MFIDLIFLSNELMNPSWQRELRVPLEFINFGFVEGKMYYMPQRKSTFNLVDVQDKWGNTVIYGAFFLIRDYHYYIRALDAYMFCSKSALGRNHVYDMQHRINVEGTQIAFRTTEDFCKLKYQEVQSIVCEMYVGNTSHPKLNHRLTHRHRVTDGLDTHNFKELIREVK